jgi:hypothetical protein
VPAGVPTIGPGASVPPTTINVGTIPSTVGAVRVIVGGQVCAVVPAGSTSVVLGLPGQPAVCGQPGQVSFQTTTGQPVSFVGTAGQTAGTSFGFTPGGTLTFSGFGLAPSAGATGGTGSGTGAAAAQALPRTGTGPDATDLGMSALAVLFAAGLFTMTAAAATRVIRRR